MSDLKDFFKTDDGKMLNWENDVQLIDFIAFQGEGYFVDVSAYALYQEMTITLPTAPIKGDQVGVRVVGGDPILHAVQIEGGTNKVEGTVGFYSIFRIGFTGVFTFIDTTLGWVLTQKSTIDSGSMEALTYDTQLQGGVQGGELNYAGTFSITVESVFCVADDGVTPLFKSRSTNNITGMIANELYYVFVVKYDSGLMGIETDTAVGGDNLPATVVAKRWLGFVRSNSSSQLCRFVQNGDFVHFGDASECIITTGLSTTYSVYSHSPFVPTDKVELIAYGANGATDAHVLSSINSGATVDTYIGKAIDSGVDDANAWGQSSGDYSLIPYHQNRQFKVSTGSGQYLLIHAVKLKR